MQKLSVCFIGFIVFTLVYSCNPKVEQTRIISQHGGQKAKLEVIYFHPSMRCAACNAVENNTIKVLQEYFHSQVENGTIRFVSFNMDEDSNKALVEKYEISFSTLLLVRKDSLNEIKTDFTAKAFQYALAKPLKYKEILKEEIDKNLKME
jgi:hypothetical protein